jgi:hypothetical protein
MSETMKNKLLRAFHGSRIYVIEPDIPEIGAYLRIYENGRDVADHLQDSVEDCVEFAFEEFGVPTDVWQESVS